MISTSRGCDFKP